MVPTAMRPEANLKGSAISLRAQLIGSPTTVHILEMNGDSYRPKQSKRRPRYARAAGLPDSPPEQ